jgi:hypothetical protein
MNLQYMSHPQYLLRRKGHPVIPPPVISQTMCNSPNSPLKQAECTQCVPANLMEMCEYRKLLMCQFCNSDFSYVSIVVCRYMHKRASREGWRRVNWCRGSQVALLAPRTRCHLDSTAGRKNSQWLFFSGDHSILCLLRFDGGNIAEHGRDDGSAISVR